MNRALDPSIASELSGPSFKNSASDGVAGRPRRLILGATLCLFGLLKAFYNPYPIGSWAVDASYYHQVARHVAAGHGFLTRFSLYHQGLSPLPHPAPIYPCGRSCSAPLVALSASTRRRSGFLSCAIWPPSSSCITSRSRSPRDSEIPHSPVGGGGRSSTWATCSSCCSGATTSTSGSRLFPLPTGLRSWSPLGCCLPVRRVPTPIRGPGAR
jgi:hypothetical protein